MLSALSFALDMVDGQPEGHMLRSCYIGMTIGERLGLNEEERSTLFYALLLKDAGCSSNASKMAALFGADDLQTKKAWKATDWSRLPSLMLYVARSVSPGGAFGPGRSACCRLEPRGHRSPKSSSRSAVTAGRRSRVSWASPKRP